MLKYTAETSRILLHSELIYRVAQKNPFLSGKNKGSTSGIANRMPAGTLVTSEGFFVLARILEYS
jgi:hypothetical protein